MYKELIISVIILIFIFGLNYITQENTDYTVDLISQKLEILRKNILEDQTNRDQIIKHSNEVYDKWEELDDKMAFYIEHNEIEKVKTALTSIKSFIEVEEYSQSVEEIDKCAYILDHIHEREMISWDNIF